MRRHRRRRRRRLRRHRRRHGSCGLHSTSNVINIYFAVLSRVRLAMGVESPYILQPQESRRQHCQAIIIAEMVDGAHGAHRCRGNASRRNRVSPECVCVSVQMPDPVIECVVCNGICKCAGHQRPGTNSNAIHASARDDLAFRSGS